jgi:hypothetical protein
MRGWVFAPNNQRPFLSNCLAPYPNNRGLTAANGRSPLKYPFWGLTTHLRN